MWQLDDATKYVRLGEFDYSEALTWGSTNPKDLDPKRRERIREHASKKISQPRVNELKQQVQWWAFRIFIQKELVGDDRFDIDNAAKLVVDSFALDTIQRDQSLYGYLALYEDETLPFVRVVVVMGEPSSADHTNVEIFGSLEL